MSLSDLKHLAEGFGKAAFRHFAVDETNATAMMVREAQKPHGGDLAYVIEKYPAHMGDAMAHMIKENMTEAFKALVAFNSRSYTGRPGNLFLDAAYLANRPEMFREMLERGYGDQQYKNDRLYQLLVSGDSSTGMTDMIIKNGADLEAMKVKIRADIKVPSNNLKAYAEGINQRIADLEVKFPPPKKDAGAAPGS